MLPKECLTCAFGENPPEELGGRVFETGHWRIEHSVGPVPEGSMVLVLRRHIPRLGELNEEEAAEMGRLQVALSGAIEKVTKAYRVYVSLWNEGSNHVHWVFMPVTAELRQKFGGLKASRLQAAMKEANYSPDPFLARQYSAQIKEILLASSSYF